MTGANRRAFRVTWHGLGGVAAAESAGQARGQAFRAIVELWGRQVRFADIRVRRVPEWDAWAAGDGSGHCWDEKILAQVTGRKKEGV